jgi:hypothetical protein
MEVTFVEELARENADHERQGQLDRTNPANS